MKKRISEHIKKQDFVKIFLTDEDDLVLRHFEGIIFEQNDKFVLMNDTADFNYDGFIILRKSDISRIKHTEQEKFIKYIIDEEKITDSIIKKQELLNFSLDNFKNMFIQLEKLKLPIIIECHYKKDNRFQIGPIQEITDKKVKLKYFNAYGEFDIKPTTTKFTDITFVRIDSPYANIFYRYSREVQ